jgi:DNA-binding CsgD family transcriptional regulator
VGGGAGGASIGALLINSDVTIVDSRVTGALGGPGGRGGQGGQARLSRRERQVVTEAGKGFPNKLIGYNLGLSPSTVATLIQRAMSRLKLNSRAQLIELSTRLARGLDEEE